MEYPPGFPNHLKPRVELLLLRSSLEFPRDNQVKRRIEAAFFSFTEIVCEEVKSGKWRNDLALECIYDFLHCLCVWDQANAFSPVSPAFLRFSEPIKQEITRSKRWLDILEILAMKCQENLLQNGAEQAGSGKIENSAKEPRSLPKSSKKNDLSNYLDAANLTDRQYQCASLRWEYELPVAAIARELHISRPTVDQHLASSRKKMEYSGQYEKMKKNLAKTNTDDQ